MSAPAKQKKAGWGSLLSGAVAGLESKLDGILAEDNEALAKIRVADMAIPEAKRPRDNSGNLGVPSTRGSAATSRDASRTRVNDRLAKRLADATAAKTPSQAGSQVPSRIGSPVVALETPRTSGESRRSGDIPRSISGAVNLTESVRKSAIEDGYTPPGEEEQKDPPLPLSAPLNSRPPTNTARYSTDSAPSRPSFDAAISSALDSPPLSNGVAHEFKTSAEYEAEIARMREDHLEAEKLRQEEMHANLERIDALQAKLKYLAEQSVAAAKEANASAAAGSAEQRLAERDEQIAQLMEEGERLSKTELRHLSTIKKLRANANEDQKSTSEIKRRLVRAEQLAKELKTKLQRADVAERQANEQRRQIAAIEKQVDELNEDRESASELIRSLTVQLSEAERKISAAERQANTKSLQADENRIASLENELEDAQIEKKLAEDRATAEIRKITEAAESEKQRLQVAELGLRRELQSLESKAEALRAQAEENSSDSNGEGHAKLLRQVETLQTQYSLAAENWHTIEGSLNARVSALEKERDEATKREVDIRKKARDLGGKARKTEEELESATEKARALGQDLKTQQELRNSLLIRLEHTEQTLSEARADFDRQRRMWDVELSQRLEEEKARWQAAGSVGQSTPGLRTNSPGEFQRNSSTADAGTVHSRRTLNRIFSHELATLHTDRLVSQRSSALPTPGLSSTRARRTPDKEASPSISRQESTISLDIHSMQPTPSIDADEAFEGSSSPHQTINDMVSTNKVGTGPSVQLVERMSAAVRRLESEKAAAKDELARLSSQRDEARNEVVSLMREVEKSRAQGKRVTELEAELKEIKKRYDASLEMLGEREEEVVELKADIADLKKIYRELVEQRVK